MRKSKSHLPKKRVMKAFSNAIKALNTESSSSKIGWVVVSLAIIRTNRETLLYHIAPQKILICKPAQLIIMKYTLRL